MCAPLNDDGRGPSTDGRRRTDGFVRDFVPNVPVDVSYFSDSSLQGNIRDNPSQVFSKFALQITSFLRSMFSKITALGQ